MEKFRTILKELGAVMLFSCAMALLMLLIALLINLIGGGGILNAWWRLCAFVGAVILLMTAVVMLTNRVGSLKMELWENRFPHLPFICAVLLVGVVLLLVACTANYLVS